MRILLWALALVGVALLWRYVPTCAHRDTYRERRKLHGVMVMHFVCERCGHARPAMVRTAREHRQATTVSRASSARLLKPPAAVIDMPRKGRR